MKVMNECQNVDHFTANRFKLGFCGQMNQTWFHSNIFIHFSRWSNKSNEWKINWGSAMSRPLDWRSNSKLTFSRLRKIWRKIICCPDGARIPRVSARSTENRFTFRFLRRRLQWWFLPLLSALADETFLFPCVPFDRMVQRERESHDGANFAYIPS